MRTLAILAAITAAAVSAQTTPSAPIQHIQAELGTAVKLTKAKVGDKLKAQTVTAVTLANGTAVPIGSTLLGQVLQIDNASVTISFDQANVEGHKIPLAVTLVSVAMLGGSRTQMSNGGSNAKMDSPSGGSLPNDHPLNGGPYSVTEAGANAARGVSHESLSEVNSHGTGSAFTRGADTPAHAGSVIGMPGVTLTIDDGPPYASKFELTTKDLQLPKGIQLMFSVR